MSVWDKLEYIKEQMGAEELADELARALNADELEKLLDYIARNWDIDLEGYDLED